MILFQDSLAAPNGTLLEAHDASYSRLVADRALEIESNRIVRPAAYGASYEITIDPPSSDYAVQAVISRGDSSGTAYVRARRTANGMYLFGHSSSTGWELRKFWDAANTVLASAAYSMPQNTDHTIRLEVEGDQVRGYVNGVLTLSVQDASITAAGRPGLEIYASTGWPYKAKNHRLAEILVETLATGGDPDEVQAFSGGAVVAVDAAGQARMVAVATGGSAVHATGDGSVRMVLLASHGIEVFVTCVGLFNFAVPTAPAARRARVLPEARMAKVMSEVRVARVLPGGMQ